LNSDPQNPSEEGKAYGNLVKGQSKSSCPLEGKGRTRNRKEMLRSIEEARKDGAGLIKN